MKTIRGISSKNLSLAIAASDLPSSLRGTLRAVLTFAPVSRDQSPGMYFTHSMVGRVAGVKERQVSNAMQKLISAGVILERKERLARGQRREEVRYLNADWFLDCAKRLCEEEEDYLREAGERIKAYSEVIELDTLDAAPAVTEDADEEEEAPVEAAPEPVAEAAPEPTQEPAVQAVPAGVREAFEGAGKYAVVDALSADAVRTINTVTQAVAVPQAELREHLAAAIAAAGTAAGTAVPRNHEIASWTVSRIKELLIDADLRAVLTGVERDALVEPKGTEGIDKVNKRVHALKVQGVNLAAALAEGRKASTTSADSYREGAAEWLLHWGFKNANRSHASAHTAVSPSAPSATTEVDPRLAALVVHSN